MSCSCTFPGVLPYSQGQNLAMNVLYVPYSLDYVEGMPKVYVQDRMEQGEEYVR